MKLSRLDMVNRHAEVRAKLNSQLAAIDGKPTCVNPVHADRGYVITINGERADDALLAVARPAIRAELEGRIASIDRDLKALGVEI